MEIEVYFHGFMVCISTFSKTKPSSGIKFINTPHFVDESWTLENISKVSKNKIQGKKTFSVC